MSRTLIFIILTINSAYANYAQVLKRDGTNVTLTTNLDDNQICYIHMYGLRINARRPGSPYLYGYLPKMGMNALFLVTTSDSNVTLASASEFINATQYSDHSLVYNASKNYCDIASEFIAQAEASNTFRRQTSPFALRDHSGCDTLHCADKNAYAPHREFCSDCSFKILFSGYFEDRHLVSISLAFAHPNLKRMSSLMFPFSFPLISK